MPQLIPLANPDNLFRRFYFIQAIFLPYCAKNSRFVIYPDAFFTFNSVTFIQNKSITD